MAALLVVGFHLWPEQIRGGFAGVDVFFVISGFLITGHLTRELMADGTIRLPSFYARRARRLLPAALTVLLAGAAGVFVVLPVTAWDRSFHEILASALYFENWSLAAASVDYFAAENAPTVVQHYWSLSVEEQFYLGWPVLFLLAGAVSRRISGERRRRWALAVVPALVLVASFAWSVRPAASGADYFSTFTRAWEFAAGGLLALVGTGRSRGRGATALSGAGWAAVLGSGLVLTSTMRFPGWVAVFPVLGTAAAIAAGTPAAGFGLGRLIRCRPVQFLGGISYSLYLWHWPVVILIGREPDGVSDSGVNRFALLALSIGLAVLSTYLIEAPLRRRRTAAPSGSSARSGRRRIRLGGTAGTLVLAATGMALVSLVAGVGLQRVQSAETVARAQLRAVQANPPDCFGAAALDPLRPNCRSQAGSSPKLGSPLIPSPVVAAADKPVTCMQDVDRARLKICTTGPPASAASHEVAVIGDSHAMAWMPALQKVAQERGWRLIALLKQSCPLTAAVRVIETRSATSCVAWNKAVQDWLVRHPSVDQVIVSASSKNEFVPDPGRSWQETAVQGYLTAWAELPDSITRIVVLRDVPRPRSEVVACSESALNRGQDVRRCGLPAAQALLYDPEVDAAARSDRSPVVLDLNRYFCADGYCSPEVGGAFVYRDAHHITATFARSLATYLAEVVPSAPGKRAQGDSESGERAPAR